MTTELLREAATVLRERATAALNVPWELVAGRVVGVVENYGIAMVAMVADPVRKSDAAYIATVHPAVGLALADLLGNKADQLERHKNRVFEHRATQERGEDCGCAYKDCYECGMWHSCHHVAPTADDETAVAAAILGRSA